MAKRGPKIPMTMAIRILRDADAPFEPHLYRWEKSGTAGSALALSLPHEQVVKTLVFETSEKDPVVVLMDGPNQVSPKGLARHLGVRSVAPIAIARAESLTGYRVGGISPFGHKTPMPIVVPAHLMARDLVTLNGGKRGFLISIAPALLTELLGASVADGLIA